VAVRGRWRNDKPTKVLTPYECPNIVKKRVEIKTLAVYLGIGWQYVQMAAMVVK